MGPNLWSVWKCRCKWVFGRTSFSVDTVKAMAAASSTCPADARRNAPVRSDNELCTATLGTARPEGAQVQCRRQHRPKIILRSCRGNRIGGKCVVGGGRVILDRPNASWSRGYSAGPSLGGEFLLRKMPMLKQFHPEGNALLLQHVFIQFSRF